MPKRNRSWKLTLPIMAAWMVGVVPVLIDKEASTPLKKISKFIENIESMVIVGGGVRWLVETGDRRQKKHYEAWQIINNAAAAKVPTSYARITALQDLNADGVPLQGLDVPGADLSEIDLQGANLREANLREANLRGANLRGADLEGADLSNVKNLKLEQIKGALNCNYPPSSE